MAEMIAAVVYCIATVGVVAFQLALAAGMPWGELAMGGKYPGKLPDSVRVAEVVQAALLAGLALAVGARAGLWLPSWVAMSQWATWVAAGISALSLLMNAISQSPRERAIWTPVAAILLSSSVVVALSAV